MLQIFTNQMAYLIYFFGLIGVALLLEILRQLGCLAAAGVVPPERPLRVR